MRSSLALGDKPVKGRACALKDKVLHLDPGCELISAREIRRWGGVTLRGLVSFIA
jgi:hypothetical protein